MSTPSSSSGTRTPRKEAPRVKTGRRRNRWARTLDGTELQGTSVLFECRRPGRGYRHVLRRSDIERFISLLPDWDELSDGLDGIVLLPGQSGYQGWCLETWVGICAWERHLWHYYDRSYLDHPRESITRLGVPVEPRPEGLIMRWTEDTVRAYQLLDVLLHELGHHRDRMSTRSKKDSARGEPYAEQYASCYATQIWDDYCAEFGLVVPAGGN